MKVKTIFWNDLEGRIRSGWRVLATWLLMLLVFLPIQALVKPMLPGHWTRDQKIDLLLVCFAVVATVVMWVSRTWIDKRAFVSLGLDTKKWMLKDIAAGYLISAILVTTILVIEMGFGWLSFEIGRVKWLETIPKIMYLFLVTGLAVAWWENLFFVGYLFLNLRDGCGFWWSVILNCLIFGLIHAINPNTSIWAFGGIVLIHAYEIFGFLKTGNLWLILGIHAGWNFFQGLAGFTVSGRTGIQVLEQTNNTPAWFGGGKFGPEAGVVMVLTGILAFTLITLYAKWTRKNSTTSTNALQ